MTAAQDAALAHVRRRSTSGAATDQARLTINFHPDRIARDDRPVLASLRADGEIRNQFETGISAGGLDHVLGGSRSGWEHAMFGGAYDHSEGYERPRYAGLSMAGEPWGACPRFGSSHLVLRPHLRERATYTWGDSSTGPTAFGTWGRLGEVIAAGADHGWAELVHGARRPDQLLDVYIEAQLHSSVRLDRDVEALVLDASFHESQIAALGEATAARYDIPLRWAPTRVLDPSSLDPRFRTEASPQLAMQVNDRLGRPGQRLDAELIGRAAQEVVRADAVGWEAYGDVTQVLQELKYLWHHLVAFGAPT